MNFDLTLWMKSYVENVKTTFCERIVFIGLQGSYARGEATENSDIDVVLILDKASPEDLRIYGKMLDKLPEREKICGFISGIDEIIDWTRSDLFQFYYDTTPYYGSLDFLVPLIKKEDVIRAVRTQACDIYHICGHNIVHEKNGKILTALYKNAVFILQADYYCKTGVFKRTKSELLPLLTNNSDREIMNSCIELYKNPELSEKEFDKFSDKLFIWSSGLIRKFKGITRHKRWIRMQP